MAFDIRRERNHAYQKARDDDGLSQVQVRDLRHPVVRIRDHTVVVR